MDAFHDKIRNFITQNFYLPEPASLVDADSLIDQGVIDSTGVLEVIDFLETEFGIAVEEGEMRPENLDSVDRITAFVARKTAA